MFLAIDIGNTNITLGVYEGERLARDLARGDGPRSHARRVRHPAVATAGAQGRAGAGDHGVAIASVVPSLTGTFRQVSIDYLHQEPLVVDAGVKTGVRIRYENPREVGADRVVDCAAVQAKYGGPACVVDFGTATTFDAISREGDYLGGAIAPGIGIAAEALFCAGLQALSGGACRPGARRRHEHRDGHAVRHLLRLCGAGGGTGGALPQGAGRGHEGHRHRRSGGGRRQETPVIQHVDPWLTLDGLRIIYELNRGDASKR